MKIWKLVEKDVPRDGSWDGIITRCLVEFSDGVGTFQFHSSFGIHGIDIPCKITVKDGIPSLDNLSL